MPESRKSTLTELAARFSVGKDESIKQRYPENKHFLLFYPDNNAPNPVVWTSSNKIHFGATTQLNDLSRRLRLKAFVVPSAIVQPLAKKQTDGKDYISVGRDPSNEIQLTSKEVSKFHAALWITEKLLIRDLESTNGTFLNHIRMFGESRYYLSSQTEIKFGDIKSTYLTLEDLIEIVRLMT